MSIALHRTNSPFGPVVELVTYRPAIPVATRRQVVAAPKIPFRAPLQARLGEWAGAALLTTAGVTAWAIVTLRDRSRS